MKKTRLFLATTLVFLLALQAGYGQRDAHQSAIQIFMPKNVSVGDRAELRYIFKTEADVFSDHALTHVELVSDYAGLQTAGGERENRCAITGASIDRAGNEYTLVITLIPWKAGDIDFLPLDLAQWVRLSLQKKQSTAAFEIDLAPVHINSLVQQIKATSMRPSAPPLVVPGTTAILVALALVLLLLLSLVTAFLLRLSALSAFLRTKGAVRYMHKQARLAFKQLRHLERENAKNPLTMRLYAERLQRIVRSYLSRRFKHNFAASTTPNLALQCEQLLDGGNSEGEQTALDALTALFMRTDYLRFAAYDESSCEEQAALLSAATTCITLFDTERI